MKYWIVCKVQNGKFIYVSGTDEYGYPMHAEDKSEAWRFYDFNVAMSYFNQGYAILKEET